MSPNPLAIGYTINSLPPVITVATELAGGLFEVELLAGPVAGAYVNKQLTIEQLLDYLGAQLPSSGGAIPVILFFPDGRALLNAEAERLLALGQLYYLHPDGSGVYRTTIQVASFGVSPEKSADENAQAIDDMRTALLGE